MKTYEEYEAKLSDLGKQALEARAEGNTELERKLWDEQTELDHELRHGSCRSCGVVSDEIAERYSFGTYAGRLCLKCCSKYRDNCGIDQPQGRVEELDEFAYGGYTAIDGD